MADTPRVWMSNEEIAKALWECVKLLQPCRDGAAMSVPSLDMAGADQAMARVSEIAAENLARSGWRPSHPDEKQPPKMVSGLRFRLADAQRLYSDLEHPTAGASLTPATIALQLRKILGHLGLALKHLGEDVPAEI